MVNPLLIKKNIFTMGILKTALIGLAVYGAVKYITKKDELTGKSIVDDLKDKAPEFMDKAKSYAENMGGKADDLGMDYTR